MALALKNRNLDHETGYALIALFHSQDAKERGINHGDMLSLVWHDLELFVTADITDSVVKPGEVGLYEDIWSKYKIPDYDSVVVETINRPESLEYIKKKLLGQKLTEHELEVIMEDIARMKIRDVEVAYFMATFFNPGFDKDEVLWTARSMAKAGEILSFKGLRNKNKIVVDKHSIGGVAAKGITPILVPIIASCGLVIPNTSTRAITTPAGTSDILETVMPVGFTANQLQEIVKETGACMIWGGSLNLAPADDVLIHVERGLHIQSYQKFLVSIVAKKIAMGITHILIDIPYGKGTKVEDPDDVSYLSKEFIDLFAKVGIKCEIFKRHVVSTDGNGIGPNLEMRDILRILEQDDNRARMLEENALQMCGSLLELSGEIKKGTGYDLAREKLVSGEALEKFWEIAFAQGATRKVTSEDIEVADESYTYKAEKDFELRFINNKEIVKIARALGTPFIKSAGIYLHKNVGEKIKKGEPLMTLYATSKDRLKKGKQTVDMQKLLKL